jgi:multiple sugar transport system permease protein
VTLRPGAMVRHGVLMGAVLVTLLPIVFTAVTSLKFRRDIISGRFFDFEVTWVNYQRLFEGSRAVFGQLTLNSLIAGIGSTLLVLAIASLGGYALSRFRLPPRVSALVLGWLLFVYMLPPITFAGPFYLIARQIGLFDTPAVLVIAHAVLTLPFAVWLLQSFFAEIPTELEEAAALDGASRAGTFWRIALPMTLPGLYATAILTFVFSWKDFLFALVLTSTPRGGTIPIGIASFVQEWDLRYGEMAAATMLAAVPAILLVLFAQRHIIKGMTMGAVKG